MSASTQPLPETAAAQEIALLRAQLAQLQADNLALQQALAQSQLAARDPALEAQVQLRTEELLAANRELEAFSYSVSHDLRAPLRHIVGYIELFRHHVGPATDPKAEKYLATITDAALRMGQLIDGLLSFSRLGRAALAKGVVDFNSLVASSRSALAQDCASRAIAWEIAPLPAVHGDAVLLREVWANLLENALKYTRPREVAHITIGWQPGEAGAQVFFVRDNGVGFDMAHAHKLFGVFQRLHHVRDFEGTGIGLALARRIVERHGGRIWADSTPEKGSCFYFSLPPSPAGTAAEACVTILAQDPP
jgi:light-regulated signal transduction histidine kinase (bacteriophytochrome)